MGVKTTKTNQDQASYPCLKISEIGNIVLFSEPNAGTLLYPKPGSTYEVGHHTAGWRSEDFRPYHGTITLENT